MTGNSYRMMLFLIQKEIAEHGLPFGLSRKREIVKKWRETVDDFEAFAKHARTGYYEFNKQLVNETRDALSN